VFAAVGVHVLRIPPQAPMANAYAERWLRTVRTECLDWLLILNRHHLHRLLTAYLRHYSIDVLGGLIHEYQHAA
jgi:transposase InsO family protein